MSCICILTWILGDLLSFSEIWKMLEARRILGMKLPVVAIVRKTRLDASLNHSEESVLERLWDVRLSINLLHVVIDDSRLEHARVQEREPHLWFEELSLRQGFLRALLLIRLQLKLLFFFGEGVVGVQSDGLVGTTERPDLCTALKDSLVFLELLTIPGQKHLLALLGTLGSGKILWKGLTLILLRLGWWQRRCSLGGSRLSRFRFLLCLSRSGRSCWSSCSGSSSRSTSRKFSWLFRLVPHFINPFHESRDHDTFSHICLRRRCRGHKKAFYVGFDERKHIVNAFYETFFDLWNNLDH